MNLSCAGFRQTQGPSHRAGRARGGDRQVQLQGQHASDPGWKAAKGAGEQWGTPCFRELNTASEGSETELPRPFPGGRPLASSWARPDADWTPPRPGSASGRRSPLSQGICFSRAAPKPNLIASFAKLCFYFLECSQIDKLKHTHVHTHNPPFLLIPKYQCSGFS